MRCFVHFFYIFSKNSAMEWYYILSIAVAATIVLILFFPMFLQFRFYINALENLGTISITLLWIIPLAVFQVELRKDAINILTRRRKNNEKEIKIFQPNTLVFAQFSKNLFARIKMFDLSTFFFVGIKNDAMNPAIIAGIYYSTVHSFMAVLHNKKGNFVSHIVGDTSSEENGLKVSGYNLVFILPITVIACFLKARKSVIKMGREYERIRARFKSNPGTDCKQPQ